MLGLRILPKEEYHSDDGGQYAACDQQNLGGGRVERVHDSLLNNKYVPILDALGIYYPLPIGRRSGSISRLVAIIWIQMKQLIYLLLLVGSLAFTTVT